MGLYLVNTNHEAFWSRLIAKVTTEENGPVINLQMTVSIGLTKSVYLKVKCVLVENSSSEQISQFSQPRTGKRIPPKAPFKTQGLNAK